MDTNKPLHNQTPSDNSTTNVKTTQSPQAVQTTTLGKKPTEGASAPEVTTTNIRVVQSDQTFPLPGIGKRPVVTLDMTKPVDDTLNIDKDTVVYLVYLLFKTNMIARNNLRNIIDEIGKPLPDNVLKWLVNEAAKAGR